MVRAANKTASTHAPETPQYPSPCLAAEGPAVGDTSATSFQPLNWKLLDQMQPSEPVIPDMLSDWESDALIGSVDVGKPLLELDIGVALAAWRAGVRAADPRPRYAIRLCARYEAGHRASHKSS